MKARVKIKNILLISLGVFVLVLACLFFVGFVVFIAIKQPLAFMGGSCGAGFFMMLRDVIEMFYEIYKERNKKDEKV